MHKVVHDVAEDGISITSHLEFVDESVIIEASIAEPVNQIVGATFLWQEGYNDTGLGNAGISMDAVVGT
jgi:hypothetical protein